MSSITIHSTVKLNDGKVMPSLGLGTWRSWGQECEHAVQYALLNGYDHIDTAQAYDNEAQVGRALKASARPRDEIFITTKIANHNQGFESSKQSFKRSLKDLATDFVDLLLIHWPNIHDFEKSIDTWQALIDLQKQGLCRSIGVSNFTNQQIETLLSQFDVIPAVNQVEFHTFLYQKELLEGSRAKGIQIVAYSPVARAQFFDHADLSRIAEKYKKTPAQMMLAWCLNHNLVVIPKSISEKRIQENSDIFFVIEDDDMAVLDNLHPQVRLVNA